MKKKHSGCMCTFANQIKTIKLFKYEKNASKYSLFELRTPNNSTYIDVHTGQLHEYTCLSLWLCSPQKIKLVGSATETSLTPEI